MLLSLIPKYCIRKIKKYFNNSKQYITLHDTHFKITFHWYYLLICVSHIRQLSVSSELASCKIELIHLQQKISLTFFSYDFDHSPK